MKKLISIALALTMCVSFVSCVSKEAKNAQNLINSLPDEYTSDIEQSFSEAKSAYDLLSEEDKANVDNTKINELEISKKVYEVQQIINALPDKYTEDYEGALKDAQSAYDALSDQEKSMADNTKIINLEKSREEFQQQQIEMEIHSYASKVNGEVEVYASKTTDLKGINDCYKQLVKVNDMINEAPEESLKYVDFDRISKKNDELTKAIDRILGEIKEVHDVTGEFTNIYTSMDTKISYKQYTWIYTSCGIILSDLNTIEKYTSVNSEIKDKVKELQSAAQEKNDFSISIAWVGVISRGIEDVFKTAARKYTNIDTDIDTEVPKIIENIQSKVPEGGVVAVEPIMS